MNQATLDYIHTTIRRTERRDLHLLGATGTASTVMDGKREYLVVPVVALMEGVIHAVNAETPEFVPFSTLEKSAASWNGKPVTLGHPKKDGKQCSANDPGIVASHGLGIIKNARVDVASKKMLMDAYVDVSKAKKLAPDAYQTLADGGTLEVSVGAMVVSDHKRGTQPKPFVGSWTFAEGDHLALLPGGRGACSVAMGCGTHRAAQMRICAEGMELIVELSIIDPVTLRCLRDIPQSERDKMSESDFAGPDQSFPIKTQADVDAASHLVGKAKDPAAVKARIISIAKRKGLKIPDAWMKTAAAGDTEDSTDPEEQAELIAYQTLRSTWDSLDPQWDAVSKTIDDLIADETDDATETDAEEAAEEQVETARIESIRTQLSAMLGAIQGMISLTYGQSLSDAPSMRGYAGARHSKADTSAIQMIHDQAQALGANCDRSNYALMEEHQKPEAASDDPTIRYIQQVRQRAASAR